MRTTLQRGGLLKLGFNTTKFIGTISFMMLFLVGIGNSLLAKGSVLELTTPQNQEVIVEIDGKRYYSDCLLTVRGLNNGQHRLKVLVDTRSSCGNGGSGRLLFNGVIDIPHNSKMEATIHPRQGLCIDDISPLGRTMNPDVIYRDPVHRGSTNRDTRNNRLSDQSHRSSVYDEVEVYNDYNSFTDNHGISYSDHYEYEEVCIEERLNLLTVRELNELLSEIQNRSFDRDRLRFAKRLTSNYDLNSHQVRQIMETLCFENTKVDFAKHAYGQVVDPHRFHLVYTALTFSSSERELDRFING